MKIKVTVTEVWYVETDEYTVKELREDEKSYGCLGMDLARDEGSMESRTISYSRAKEEE